MATKKVERWAEATIDWLTEPVVEVAYSSAKKN